MFNEEEAYKKIKRMKKISNKIIEKMRKYGEFGVELKDGSYFYFYGMDFVITYDTVTEHVIIEGYKGNEIIFENWIKAKNIKDIFPTREVEKWINKK